MAYREAQWEAMQDYWDRASIRERVEWCQEEGVSNIATDQRGTAQCPS